MLLKAIRQVDPSDTAAVETVVRDELVPNIQGRVDALRTLGYPEGDMKTLDAIYAQSEIALARLTEDPGLFFSADPFADVDSALTDYGLDSCGA